MNPATARGLKLGGAADGARRGRAYRRCHGIPSSRSGAVRHDVRLPGELAGADRDPPGPRRRLRRRDGHCRPGAHARRGRGRGHRACTWPARALPRRAPAAPRRSRPGSGRLPGERARAQPGHVRLRTGGDRSGGRHPAVRGRGGRRRVGRGGRARPGAFVGPSWPTGCVGGRDAADRGRLPIRLALRLGGGSARRESRRPSSGGPRTGPFRARSRARREQLRRKRRRSGAGRRWRVGPSAS